MPDPVSIPPDFPFASLRSWEAGLDKGTRERGALLAKEGASRLLDVSSERVDGVVPDSGPWPCRATLLRLPRTGAWVGRCDCPVGVSCKHAVALALLLLASDPGSAELSAGGAPVPSGFLAEAAEALGREPTRREAHVLHAVDEAFRAGPDSVTGRRHVEAALQALLGADRTQAFRLVEEVATSGAASSASLLAAMTAALGGIGRAVPPWCGLFIEKAGAGDALAREREVRAVRDWRLRLAGLAGAAGAPAREQGRRELRLRRVFPDRLRWEVRVTPEEDWRPLSPAEREAWGGAAFDPGAQFSPEGARAQEMFRVFAKSVSASGEVALPSESQAPRGLASLLRRRRMRDCLAEADGRPADWSDLPLVWSFVPVPGNSAALRPVLAFADGASAPAPLFALGDGLYLAPSGFFEGPRPLGDFAGVGTPPDIPYAAFADEGVRRALQATGARVREPGARPSAALVPCVRVVPEAGPSGVEGREYMFARLSGLDAEGRERLRWVRRSWEVVASAADSSSEPSSASLGDALVVFKQGPAYDGDSVMLPLSVHSIDEVSAWLRRFPAGTRFELPSELHALLRDPERAEMALEMTAAPGSPDWFDLRLVLRPEDAELTPGEIKLLLAHRGGWVRLPGKGWRRMVASVSDEAREKLAALGIDPLAPRAESLRFHSLQLDADRLAGLATARGLAALRARRAALAAQPAPALPSGLNATLRPYQTEGFRFLAHLSANGLGGILADDMGLGKTLQTLAWLLWLKETSHAADMPNASATTRGRSRKSEAAESSSELPFRALVVAPKSVVPNWVTESRKFAPALNVAVHGVDSSEACSGADLVVVNYARLRLASDAFLATEWTAVVLDEGQHIKNPTSQVAETARALKARHRLILSGTPVENRLMDLWSLCAFAMPGLLGSHASFKRHYDERRDPGAPARLAARVRPFLLRRTKAQVAPDLPERVEEDLVVNLEPAQRRLYDAELKKARALLLRTRTAGDFDKARFNIVTSLLRLRQICCDPRLVSPKAKAADSAKLDALRELLLPLVSEGHKVLVFSQFTEALALVSEMLSGEGVAHLTITGATENRAGLVARFQRPDTEKVFLLSLKAAGTGLNLTAASYVVLFDPWWNPAAEAQAIDRTHRIGQKNKVIAYRLLTRETVEEKIRALQRDKAALAGEILREESLAKVLDLETLRGILSE